MSTSQGAANTTSVFLPDKGTIWSGNQTSISLTSTGVLFSVDTTGYNSVAVQVTSAGTTCTITYEGSDDNTNWLGVEGQDPSSIGTYLLTTTTARRVVFQTPFRYFRARVSTYTSGTVTVNYTLSQSAGISPVISNISIIATPAGQALYTYKNINTASTTTVKSGVGNLYGIAINNPGATSPLITIFDNTTATGTLIGTILPTTTVFLNYNCHFTTGLTIVTAGGTSPDITVSYI